MKNTKSKAFDTEIDKVNHHKEIIRAKAAEMIQSERISEVEAEADTVTTRFLRNRENQLDRQTLRLAQALIGAGFKVTNPRLAIIEEIVGFDREFEITELTDRLELRPDHKAGVASVFRTVKLFTELGLIQRIHSGDGCHRYGLVRGHNHQVVCRCCERSIEFQGCDFTELTRFLELQTGFKLEGHWMEFFGLCTECSLAELKTLPKNNLPLVPLAPHQHHQAENIERSAPLNISTVSQIPV